MEIKNKIFCHWEFVRLLKEDILRGNGKSYIISVTDGENLEIMIFLGKSESDFNYEVRVYKNKATDQYVKHDLDKVLYYEDNDKYATFFFDTFYKAKCFASRIRYLHPEYRIRPAKKIVDND